MAVTGVLRFTFALPEPDPVQQSDVFRAALEMAKWGESRGVGVVSVDEHHVTGYGWSPNPILEAGCMLAATSSVIVMVQCALGPLWNPIRMAEDIAVVDQISRGRLVTIVGLGYRPEEYAAMGVDFSQRGRLMDRLIDTLLKAWSGEPFDFNGATIRVSPIPLTRPHPMLWIGGSVKASARRAVKFGLPFNVPDHIPELEAYYRELCAAEGQTPIFQMPAADEPPTVFLHEDPDRAWAELGRHFQWEAVHYGQWATPDMKSIMHVPGARTLEDVRKSGRYLIVTPDELVARLEARGGRGFVALYPLCGGMPIDEGWKSLHLLTDQVLPRLARR